MARPKGRTKRHLRIKVSGPTANKLRHREYEKSNYRHHKWASK